jgi:hypothetical protein
MSVQHVVEFRWGSGRVGSNVSPIARIGNTSSDLTRRANHPHNDILAQIVKPAPETAAGFLLLEIPQSDGGPHVRTPHLPHASSPAGRRPNQYHSRVNAREFMPVRANAPARGVASMPRPPRPLGFGDRVRARNDRADRDLPRILFHSARKRMTAYLLSLALIGLVTIVIWEGLS